MSDKKKLFEILNNYFDKTYLITLKRSKDRHELLDSKLKGLDYEIFWGVDGKNLDRDKLYDEGMYHPSITKLLKKRVGRHVGNMSLAKIGCALSHVGVYKEIISNNLQKVLILEDDLNVNHHAVDSFINALNELPDDWELLYLGYSGSNSSPTPLLRFQNVVLTQISMMLSKCNRLRKMDPDIIKNSLSKPYSNNLNRSGANFGTHAYGVTIEGARKIIRYQTPVVQESDNVLGELCSYRWLKAFDVKDQVFYQNKNLPSTIDN